MEKHLKIQHQLPFYLLFYCIIFLCLQATRFAQSNPLPFSPNALPLIAIPPGAYHIAGANPFQASANALMMTGGQYDPYSPMQAGPYFMPAAAAYAAPWTQGMDTNRRSLSGMFGAGSGGTKAERSNGGHRDRGNQNEEPSDEQKALDGLPLSFVSTNSIVFCKYFRISNANHLLQTRSNLTLHRQLVNA